MYARPFVHVAVKAVQSVCRVAAVTAIAVGVASSAWGQSLSDRSPSPPTNIVLEWNAAALQAIVATAMGPPPATRALAIAHTCMYDAWAAYAPTAVGTQLGGALRRPQAEWTVSNKQEALSFAAYRALVDLFPTEQATFDAVMARYGLDPTNETTDATTPAGVGNLACAAVIEARRGDGSNQLGQLNGGAPYSDYTGYQPVNSSSALVDPTRWQPLPTPAGEQQFAVPHWGLVTPFALPPLETIRPAPPPPLTDLRYRARAFELVAMSAGLDDRRKMIAEYWADGPGSVTPPGHWNLFARFVSERDTHTLDDDVKLFFVLNNAMFDAGIAVWDCKRGYDYVRPVSAIRHLYAGQSLFAWGGPGRSQSIIDGATWTSYIPTPPFAEYVSGHSTFSASAAEALKLVTGSDAFGAQVVLPPGSSTIEPNLTPRYTVVLSWHTFSAAADEAGLSRRYGGIHFQEGDLYGRALGRIVGGHAWELASKYFAGVAP
ncbi:MAG: vanadium-dependent haloperoxidase [Vicinamibacteraceae bacterium]